MFCPGCKSEYLEGITVCADCSVPLVEQLPEEAGQHLATPQMKDLVTFKRFPRHHEAEVAKGLLVANGIDAIVSWDDWGHISPQRNEKYKQGIRLMIREENIKKAEDVFREAGVPLEDPPYAELSERPPPSQSQYREKLFSRISLILFILILLITLLNLFA